MKRTYKITLFLISVMLIFSLLAVSASASNELSSTIAHTPEAVVDSTSVTYSAGTSLTGQLNAAALETSDVSTKETLSIDEDHTKILETDENYTSMLEIDEDHTPVLETDENYTSVFDTVYSILLENSDKIFSLLSFAASLVIAFLYKKNLMPTIKGTVSGLSSAVARLREDNIKETREALDGVNRVNERLFETEQTLSALTDELIRIEKELDTKKRDDADRLAIREVMTSEVDMLYEIFMHSSIPQYEKDKVGERISEMKARLLAGDAVNE